MNSDRREPVEIPHAIADIGEPGFSLLGDLELIDHPGRVADKAVEARHLLAELAGPRGDATLQLAPRGEKGKFGLLLFRDIGDGTFKKEDVARFVADDAGGFGDPDDGSVAPIDLGFETGEKIGPGDGFDKGVAAAFLDVEMTRGKVGMVDQLVDTVIAIHPREGEIRPKVIPQEGGLVKAFDRVFVEIPVVPDVRILASFLVMRDFVAIELVPQAVDQALDRVKEQFAVRAGPLGRRNAGQHQQPGDRCITG